MKYYGISDMNGAPSYIKYSCRHAQLRMIAVHVHLILYARAVDALCEYHLP